MDFLWFREVGAINLGVLEGGEIGITSKKGEMEDWRRR